jgi:tetrahydromethanopterin S-methyltransferase subunit G
VEPNDVRDDVGAQQTIKATQDRRVPEALVKELHEVNQRADELRRSLEAAVDAGEFDQVRRVEAAGEELRAIERRIEDVSRRIREASPAEAKA